MSLTNLFSSYFLIIILCTVFMILFFHTHNFLALFTLPCTWITRTYWLMTYTCFIIVKFQLARFARKHTYLVLFFHYRCNTNFIGVCMQHVITHYIKPVIHLLTKLAFEFLITGHFPFKLC